jgi:hypothetical protein
MRLVGKVDTSHGMEPAIQAADFLAWHTNRYHSHDDPVAQMYQCLAVHTDIHVYDYPKLVRMYKEWRPPGSNR